MTLHAFMWLFILTVVDYGSFLGYSKNYYMMGDEILVVHSHELRSMAATPHPGKLVLNYIKF